MGARWLFSVAPGCLFSAALLALSACEGEARRDPSQYPVSRSELERNAPSDDPAELSYRRYCIGCHGSDGHGNGGTTGADLAAANGPLSTRSDAELFGSVRNGKRGNIAVMPAHSPVLDDSQIAAVVGYVRKRFGPPSASAVTTAQQPAQPSAEQQLVDRANEAKPLPRPEGSASQVPTPAPAP
jgi:cytochrome c553